MSKNIKLMTLYNEYASAVSEFQKLNYAGTSAAYPKPDFPSIIEALLDHLVRREELSLTDLRDQDRQAVGSLSGFGFFASGEVGINQYPNYPGSNDNEKGASRLVSIAMDQMRANRTTSPVIVEMLKEFKPQ